MSEHTAIIWFDSYQQVVSIPLHESSGWKRLDLNGPRPASRRDLLTILSSLEAILLRSSHSDQTIAIFLSDVSMDTAVSMQTGEGYASQVESCRCPSGYSGLSCEVMFNECIQIYFCF